MTGVDYRSKLHEFMARWVDAQMTTWDSLCKRARVSPSVGTDIKRGSTPRPDTLRRFAKAMGVPRRTLFELVGYTTEEDMETGLTEAEEKFLGYYRLLPPDRKKVLHDLLAVYATPDKRSR